MFKYLFSIYNDNLLFLAESLATIGSGTREFQKAQMDFFKRKYSGDGLGIKKGPGFYLKIVAQLILNLSVFSLLCLP